MDTYSQHHHSSSPWDTIIHLACEVGCYLDINFRMSPLREENSWLQIELYTTGKHGPGKEVGDEEDALVDKIRGGEVELSRVAATSSEPCIIQTAVPLSSKGYSPLIKPPAHQ